jgi:uncharacterized membrane protein
MPTRLYYLVDRLRSGYWFLPLAFSLGAVVLARILLALDAAIPDETLAHNPFLYIGPAETERNTLLTVATTTLGVAGVVFSLTTVPLSVAASQYGSRLLRNFLRDKTTQVTLSAYFATFVYCLAVLFTLSPQGEIPNLPHIATTGALGLALACFALLVFFIHNVAASLQAPVVIDEVADEVERAIAAFGVPVPESGAPQAPPRGPEVISRATGYIQALDDQALVVLATQHSTVIELRVQAGSYVGEGEVIGWGVGNEVLRHLVINSQRLPNQDIEFGLNQLVEIAVRAMSPAINDPFTAINCLDRLGVLLSHTLRHGLPSPTRTNPSGTLRLIRPVPTFESLCGAAFHLIRQYSRGCAEVLIRIVDALRFVSEHTALTPEQHQVLVAHARAVQADAESLPNPADRERVLECCANFLIE